MENLNTNQSSSKTEKNILIIYNDDCLLHKSSKQHPQLPYRITTIINALSQYSISDLTTSIKQNHLKNIQNEEIQKIIIKIHGERYHEFIQYMWDESYKKSQMYINIDTYYMKYTYQAAFAAVKTTLIALQSLLQKTYSYAFAVVRPPGHHSGLKNQPHGFSFFNNVAIAAQYSINSQKCSKIAIIDWDAHHGEGTQNIFYKRKDVLYISLHRYDNGKFFPHVASSSQLNCGEGQGLGFNINICWNLPQKKPNTPYNRQQSVGDEEYIFAFEKIINPVLSTYKPDLILISCGFDSGDGDPIGNLKISKNGYSFMTQSLKKLGKPMLIVLQGGYNADVLSWGSQAVINGIKIEQEININKQLKINEIGKEGVVNTLRQISKFWDLV